ncbi:hypothetical protein Poli38472_005146 [Pythium oligandrum]|uniref:PH domain-containing protein n=1 Tax=Pythium oligandrum TaxID=41045 RepID=A0A8K1CHE1_PYTOL|nr:hypothetical protein Poli38472_005146 [Pythium oligandrum]|eukprot:TMW62528.1 hypothetical protein Poli38472_005146 [Pythium oligandrum]
MELDEYVPLCTAAAGSAELRLRGAGIDVLESSRHEARRVVLLAVLQREGVSTDASNEERGLYITTKSVNPHDVDAAVLLCTLRHVNLEEEPFWGSLLLLVSSHLFVAESGPISSTSFGSMTFLSDFSQWQVLETPSGEENSVLLREFMPSLTWVALDLKIKDMEGLETPSKYFEYKLANPPMHSGPDVEAQMLASGYFTTRECIVLKTNTLQTPNGYTAPQAFTSPKILSQAMENLHHKVFFGRHLSGGVMLHLLRSLAHCISSKSPIVIQRVVQNVHLNYWKLLLESAYEKYTDMIHARLGVYEKVEFTAEYLVDITERKLQNENVGVVNAGQGQFSTFDEFGNLKRQTSSTSDTASEKASANGAPLNTGIFTFLKDRAERAFTKQFSRLSSTKSSSAAATATSAAAGLNHIPEDEAADEENEGEDFKSLWNPEDILAQYNAPIKNYPVPLEYSTMVCEAMPVEVSKLEDIHREALNDAKNLIMPFLYDLRASSVQLSELACTIDFHVGKRNLFRRIRVVKERFALANEAASTLFCAQLIDYLHTVILRKGERDHEAQQSNPRYNRATSSVMIPQGRDGKAAAPLTRLPLELLTYKNNIEALISQYNFVSRGPMASRVMLGFFQACVRKRLLALAQKQYNQFAYASDDKEQRLTELEETLEATQQQVVQHQKGSEEAAMQEARNIADIELSHKDEILNLQDEITNTNEKIEKALNDQQALYQRTMQATRKTINTIDQVAVKNRGFKGYLERYEKGHVFSKSWRQYFYVLDQATLKCYKSKSAYEERDPPCETPITLTGYSVVKSRTDEMKIKLVPPEAGQMLRFRAPASVGRETWMKKLMEATQITSAPSGGRHGR